MTNYIERVFKSKSDVIRFGKFKNKTVGYVLVNEPSYIIWLHKDGVIAIPEEIVKEAMDRDLQMLPKIRKNTWGTGYMRQE